MDGHICHGISTFSRHSGKCQVSMIDGPEVFRRWMMPELRAQLLNLVLRRRSHWRTQNHHPKD